MTFNFRLVNNEFQRFEFVIPSGSPGFGLDSGDAFLD